mgnify:CR=1 FL=1
MYIYELYAILTDTMTNLYWPVYKNLENELVQLSDLIHFDDNQLSIYSIKISELLIRCSVEIEAISKDLYFRIGGTLPSDGDLYFDTDCLQLLEDKWVISKKKVIISASNFYFENDDNKILSPLFKSYRRGTSSCDWKKAYQEVKHNRVHNLTKGSLKNLIRAMASLYVLNIYFKDEIYELGSDGQASNFPINMGSNLFSIKLHKWFFYDGQHNYGKREDFDECIYLTKYTDETLNKNREALDEMFKKQHELFIKHPKLIKYLETNKLEDYKGQNLIYDVLGKDDYNKLIHISTTEQIKVSSASQFEAILNKNSI